MPTVAKLPWMQCTVIPAVEAMCEGGLASMRSIINLGEQTADGSAHHRRRRRR